MKDLNAAHDVLSDPAKRAKYDRMRELHLANDRKTVPPKPRALPAQLDFGVLLQGDSKKMSVSSRKLRWDGGRDQLSLQYR